jgi:hypothetical protein
MERMKKNTIEISVRKARALEASLRAGPATPAGEHLSAEQFNGFISMDLPQAEIEAIMQHITACESCAALIERVAEQARAWEGNAGRKRLADLRQRGLATLLEQFSGRWAVLDRLEEALRSLILKPQFSFAPGMGRAAMPREAEGQTENGILQWYYGQDEKGDLVIRISSFHLDLEGVRLALSAGSWQQELTLEKVAPDQVGAETSIPKAELPNLQLERGLQLKLTE